MRVAIVEVAEAKKRPFPDQFLNIRELNVGVYCFYDDWLWQNIDDLPLRQARSGQAYYLTDMIGLSVAQGLHVEAIVTEDEDERLGQAHERKWQRWNGRFDNGPMRIGWQAR